MIANSAVIGGVSNLKLKITPSSFYVKSTEGCTLTCEVTFNDEDYTDVVIKWQIERISVNKQDDQEWFENKAISHGLSISFYRQDEIFKNYGNTPFRYSVIMRQK